MNQLIRTSAVLTLTLMAALALSVDSVRAQGGVVFDSPPQSHPTWGDLPGLCRLEFKYYGGDNNLKTMKGIPNLFGSNFLFDLADNDHGQGAYGLFRWWDLRYSGSLRFASAANCRDGCWIRIPPINSSQELVLAGIDFRYTGSDHHIRNIEVWPYPESGWIWVRFRDNSTSNAFNATIAYVLIPERHHYRYTSSSTANEWTNVDRPKAAGTSYIQGFKARFMNGDHEFERLFVDVCGSRVLGTLHDSGGVNDPYRLDVRYVAFQPIN